MIKDTDTAILFRKYMVRNGNIEKKITLGLKISNLI